MIVTRPSPPLVYVEMTDLLREFMEPAVMDIKMGSRLALLIRHTRTQSTHGSHSRSSLLCCVFKCLECCQLMRVQERFIYSSVRVLKKP